MPKGTVLTDRVGYVRGHDPQGRPQFATANRGDEVELSKEEHERLTGLGAIGSEEDLATAEEAATEPSPVLDDEALAALNVDDTVAYLNAHPDELDRVDALEDERTDKDGQPARRKGVDAALEALRSS